MNEEMVTLGAVAENSVEKSGPTGETFIYVDISSIDRDRKVISGPKTLPTSVAPSRAKQVLQVGDVLVSMTRPNLNQVAIVTPQFHGAIGSTGFHVLRSQWAEPKFLFYLVQSNDFIDEMCKCVQGALYPAVRPKDISSFDFFLPSSLAQQRIIAEIEKQFSRLDEAVANLKRVKANLKRYKAAVLKSAVEGKLTKEWRRQHPDVEPADKLLERILEERRDNWQKRGKYKEPVGPDTSGLPELPAGWVWASVEQLTCLVTSGSRGWGDSYSEEGSIFIRAQDIKTDSLVFENVARVIVSSSAEGTRSAVSNNDILVTITGANVTKSAIVQGLEEQAFVSQHVALLKPCNASISAFLYFWIVSPANGRQQLEKCAYGAGKPGLSLVQIRSLLIALPPFTEQHQIVAEIERRLSIVAGAEAQVDANLRRADRLRQSILKQAFSGRLVPQDSNDEPASVLLERIRVNAHAEAPQMGEKRGARYILSGRATP
jgi:type I restriction enzyme S subunit